MAGGGFPLAADRFLRCGDPFLPGCPGRGPAACVSREVLFGARGGGLEVGAPDSGIGSRSTEGALRTAAPCVPRHLQ